MVLELTQNEAVATQPRQAAQPSEPRILTPPRYPISVGSEWHKMMPGTSEELSERRSWTRLGLAPGRASPRSLGTPEGPPSGPALKASGHLEATSAQGSGTTLRSPLAAVPSSTSLPLPPSSGLAWQRPPTGREGHPRGWGSLPSHPPCRPEQGAPLPTPEFLVLPYQRNRETNPPPGMRLCVPAVKDGPDSRAEQAVCQKQSRSPLPALPGWQRAFITWRGEGRAFNSL